MSLMNISQKSNFSDIERSHNVPSFELLLEAAPLAMVTIDRTGQIVFVNARLEEMFGYPRQELLGQEIEILLPARFRDIHRQHRAGYMTDPRIRTMGSGMNLAAHHKNGAEFPIEVGLSFFDIDQELFVVGSIIDITIRKEMAEILEQRVEERTREIERRRQVADGLRETLTILNSNRSLAEILDYIVTQAVDILDHAQACAVYRLQPEEGQFTVQTSYGLPDTYLAQATIPTQNSTVGQAWVKHQSLTVADIGQNLAERTSASQAQRQALLACGYQALLAVPLLTKDKIYGGLVLYYPTPRQFSEEELNLAVTFSDQAALAIENARLRTQAEQAAVMAERSRLARDLHDSVTQTLFSASVIADVLPRLWETNRSEGQRRSQELRELTRGALAEMRTLLLELRPAKLVEIPLPDLLQQLSEAINGRARMPIALKMAGECSPPPDVQIALYRVAQEALNNVAKHARATQATVSLDCHPEHIELRVTDDGRGFVWEGIKPNNLGLIIMKERTEAIGATLVIHSQVAQGTQVVVSWQNK